MNVAISLDATREEFTISGVKTGLFSVFIFLALTCGIGGTAHAGNPPAQPATLSNVVGPESTSGASNSAGNCKVTYQVTSAWWGGFAALVTIQNKGTTPVNGWTVRWNYAGNQTISSFWNSSCVQSGKAVCATSANCNQTIPAGSAVSFNFFACYSGANVDPTAFTIQ